MECFHHSDECTVWAIGERDECHDIPDDVLVTVLQYGVEVGRIMFRWNEWENELTMGVVFSEKPALPEWICGLYVGEDYPEYATTMGYTFVD